MTLTEHEREIIIKHRLQQSIRTLNEAELLINNDSLAASVNRIYYSVFYAITALGLKYKFSTSKHRQLVGWFNKNFVTTEKVDKEFGRFIHNLFNKRMEGDYEIFIEFRKEDVLELLNKAKEFRVEIEKIIYSNS